MDILLIIAFVGQILTSVIILIATIVVIISTANKKIQQMMKHTEVKNATKPNG